MSIATILTLTGLASLAAFLRRWDWSHIVAFIIGPAALVILMKSTSDELASKRPDKHDLADTVTSSGSLSEGIVIAGLIAGLGLAYTIRKTPLRRWLDALSAEAMREQLQKKADRQQKLRDEFARAYKSRRQSFKYENASYTSQKATQASAQPLTERERHLRTLGLTSSARPAAVKKAWRKLAAKHHPDKLASQNLSQTELDAADDKMQDINAAYAWLKDNNRV